MTWLVPLPTLLLLGGAAVTFALAGRRRAQQLVTLVTFALALVLGFVLMVHVYRFGPLIMQVGGWAAPYGITLAIDRVSALLLAVSALVLISVLLFSMGQGIADGDEETPVTIFYPTYQVLGAGVLGAFIAGDLFNLYVSFEILLVASYVLITIGGTAGRIRAGITYVVVSIVSSLLFLIAIALVYGATGTVNMAHLSHALQELPADTRLFLNVALLLAFGIKAAIFPLSFWLPDSYPTAPAPVTAVFAGLLTKVGVYAILRTQTLLFPDGALSTPLYVLAGLTLIVGILGAISQLDIKRLLSFTLVSHIGFMVFGIAMQAYSATVYYIVHHIIVQTTLFLAVGLIERHGGTTTLSGLGGIARSAPFIAALFFVPAMNLAGIPPLSGFLGKLGLLQHAAHAGTSADWWLIGVSALVSLLTLYALARAWVLAFWRVKPEGMKETRKRLEAVSTQALQVRDIQLFERLEGDALPEPALQKKVPTLMYVATAGMVSVTLLLTVAAGPLLSYAQRAGDALSSSAEMYDLVFGTGQEDLAPGGSGRTKPEGQS